MKRDVALGPEPRFCALPLSLALSESAVALMSARMPGVRESCGREKRVESGEWRVESGERRVESGDWRVESGEWRVESGEWRMS
jgi:hypothetical protein